MTDCTSHGGNTHCPFPPRGAFACSRFGKVGCAAGDKQQKGGEDASAGQRSADGYLGRKARISSYHKERTAAPAIMEGIIWINS